MTHAPARGLEQLVAERAAAVGRRDADALLARQHPQVLSFPLLPPAASRGPGATAQSLQAWFEGYTDGSDKDRLDGLLATGDLGILSADGLLTVLGRDDDMVVIGGENVYVGQVEEALLAHSAVREAAVVGTPSVQNRSLMPSGSPSRARASPLAMRSSARAAAARAISGVSRT